MDKSHKCALTRRSALCKCDQTRTLLPSISQVYGPGKQIEEIIFISHQRLKHQMHFSLLCFYLASFNIRILFVHVSGEAKIRDLHFSSFSYEDVSCCEVPVDKLNPGEMLI